jgi:hypothetical protein
MFFLGLIIGAIFGIVIAAMLCASSKREARP